MICRGHKKLPEHFGFPRSQGFGVDRVNVGVGQQAQPLKPLQRGNRGGESGNRGRIENVATLHGRRHVEVVLDQKAHFRFFFSREAETRSGARQRRQAAVNVIFYRQAFAGVMQEQGKNQQVAAFLRLPQRRHLRSASSRRLGQRL